MSRFLGTFHFKFHFDIDFLIVSTRRHTDVIKCRLEVEPTGSDIGVLIAPRHPLLMPWFQGLSIRALTEIYCSDTFPDTIRCCH